MDRVAEKLIFFFALIAISIIFLIFIYVAREAFPLISGASEGISLLSPFTAPFTGNRCPEFPSTTCLPLIFGTFKVTLIAMLIATPLALAAALYTAEFAPPTIAGVDQAGDRVARRHSLGRHGIFRADCLASWVQAVFGFEFRLNALTAGIGLALAVIPDHLYRQRRCVDGGAAAAIGRLRWLWVHRKRKRRFASFFRRQCPALAPR